MKCNIQGCPGDYECRRIVHAVKSNAKVVVIDDVPAEVCSVCGDILFEPNTVRHIEKLLSSEGNNKDSAPLYHYA